MIGVTVKLSLRMCFVPKQPAAALHDHSQWFWEWVVCLRRIYKRNGNGNTKQGHILHEECKNVPPVAPLFTEGEGSNASYVGRLLN